ncbi:hypothetical protein [Jiangella sp. DSM 45060]|uniref:hypothetical protein n=1 Tax=Jiangella sp. DSM 45060 TaxID=1798224 RepID=UPI00087AA520|nr:hypothetical protein [Jiangella sp. DSM 45060]SDT69381.1 hypothetical protein SAMN04515669_6013 [Jiangella sp. DSM 45060]
MTATTDAPAIDIKAPIGAREVQAVADLLDTHRDLAPPRYLTIGRYSDDLGGNVYASWSADSREDVAAWAAMLGADVYEYTTGVGCSLRATVTVDGLDVEVALLWQAGQDR